MGWRDPRPEQKPPPTTGQGLVAVAGVLLALGMMALGIVIMLIGMGRI